MKNEFYPLSKTEEGIFVSCLKETDAYNLANLVNLGAALDVNKFADSVKKVFEAISSGCIPVYWGSLNDPEPGILNKDAIFLWNMGGDNSKSIQMIEDLVLHPKMLDEFMRQPRLVEGAEEKIVSMIQGLEEKIGGLFKE